MTEYLFSYEYAGRRYSIGIPAESLVEAQGRIEALRFAQYDGELIARVRAPIGLMKWIKKVLG